MRPLVVAFLACGSYASGRLNIHMPGEIARYDRWRGIEKCPFHPVAHYGLSTDAQQFDLAPHIGGDVAGFGSARGARRSAKLVGDHHSVWLHSVLLSHVVIAADRIEKLTLTSPQI